MKKLSIPKKQSDIKVKNLLKYQEFIENLTDEQKEDYSYITKNNIMIFYDLTEEEFNTKPYEQILYMEQIINNILVLESPLIKTFKLDGVEYAINPNLNDMTFPELVDCDTIDVIQQMCVLYRPITKKKRKLFSKEYKYNIEEYKTDIKHYDRLKEELTIDVYLGFIQFFFRIERALLLTFQKFIMEQDIDQNQKKTLEKCGDGFLGFTI